jgi:hypothetical protein
MAGLIDIKLDTAPLAGFVDRYARRVRYATYTTLNRTAVQVRQDEQEEMRRVLDRPTPYTLNSIGIDYANRDNLVAKVRFKDGLGNKNRCAERWVGLQARGGRRGMKASEGVLSRNVLGGRQVYLVPTKYAPLDAYGNVSRGAIVKILSSIRALGENSRSTTRKSRGGRRAEEYFAVYDKRPGLPPGIYRRLRTAFGNGVLPIFFFARQAPNYSTRFDFDGVARRSVQEHLQANWAAVLAEP